MDYVIVEKSVLVRLVDVHVPRGVGGGVSDHFLVEVKMKGELSYRAIRKVVQ